MELTEKEIEIGIKAIKKEINVFMPEPEEMKALSKIIDLAEEEFQNTDESESLNGDLIEWYFKRHNYM